MFLSVCVCMSVSSKFMSKISLQILITAFLILTHSLFRHDSWWDSYLYHSHVNFMLNDDFVIFSTKCLTNFLKDFSRTLHCTCLNNFNNYTYNFNKLCVYVCHIICEQIRRQLPINDNFTYYVYSHQSGDITGEHLLYIHVCVETMAVIAN